MEHGTILIVDDNPQILAIMADLLRPLGHQIVSATGGAAALELAAQNPPDVVLLDLMMPGMDGFTVTRHIRAHPLLAQVPVILVTALDDRESRVRGFEAGADEFVSKPFDYVELRARVSTILRLNRYRRIVEEQARAEAERARFVWAVEQSAEGVLILGPDDHLRYANLTARQLLGLHRGDPLSEPFLTIATRLYTPTPAPAWASWPADPPERAIRFLVRPESRAAAEAWLRVDLLPPFEGDTMRVLCIRDVTEQVSTQREMWTFHAIIEHKLRTPLVGILGGLTILHGSAATMDRESFARIAAVALDGARRLRDEIEDIIHYLHPPADPYGTDGPSVAEAAAIATQVAADLQVASATAQYEPAIATLRAGLTRHGLEVALREIFENAVKFHPRRRPTITLDFVAVSAAELAVRISDDGPGLDPNTLNLAWHPYFQGERSFTGQIEGMGLGLPLVARIVHAVGGRYEIANRAGAPGAVVTLTLPLLQEDLRREV